MRIVTPENMETVLKTLRSADTLVIDTETTGLRVWHEDIPFAVIIMVKKYTYYFNFLDYPNAKNVPVVNARRLRKIFTADKRYIFHNYKFDAAMLAKIGIEIPKEAKIYCTMTAERIIRGNSIDKGHFSLAKMAPRYGGEKSDVVEEYIQKNKLWTEIKLPGKKQVLKQKHFDKVPFSLMVGYGEKDVIATTKVAIGQGIALSRLNILPGQPPLKPLLDMEMQLLKAIGRMEANGARLDIGFCYEAIKFFEQQYKDEEMAFQSMTGEKYSPSPTLYKKIFADEEWVLTEKGNPSFTAEVIAGFKGSVAVCVNRLRKIKHNLDIFQGFVYHGVINPADYNQVYIHANFNQHMARTGRFSSSNPNLQNLDKKVSEKVNHPYIARRAIIPSDGNMLLMADYDQMEYRMLVDQAGEQDLISQINDGMDVHSVMAKKVGVLRKTIKAAIFAILYGVGDAKLAKMLGKSVSEAKLLRSEILGEYPAIGRWIESVKANALRRGYTWDWAGRIFYFNRDNVYKAPNAKIQGGCADTMKYALVELDKLLLHKSTKMILTIHDEIVFDMPKDEKDLIPEIKRIMENAYPSFNGVKLTVSLDYSNKNLADKSSYGTRKPKQNPETSSSVHESQHV